MRKIIALALAVSLLTGCESSEQKSARCMNEATAMVGNPMNRSADTTQWLAYANMCATKGWV